MRSLWAAAAAVLAVAGSLGCSDAKSTSESMWRMPASLSELHDEHFFDAPWPSDLRVVTGAPRLEGFENPRQMPILTEYVETMNWALDGFSPVAAGFVRFTGPIDPASLPGSPVEALGPLSSVQLIDVDPDSPERGQRRRVSLLWRAEAGVYWQPNTLAFMPTLGFPLRPRTRYALVATDALKGADGGSIRPSADLSAALGVGASDPRTEPARRVLAPALEELEAAGIDRARVVHLAVFTTSDPTAELFALRDDLLARVPAPEAYADRWKVANADQETWDEYVGVYGPSPNYQVGRIPFTKSGDGGAFVWEGGVPRIVNLFNLRFSLTVPKASLCPMPESGYPIVMYAHGTGGDYRSYVRGAVGAQLAELCIATMGVDQIFHGARPGAPADPADVNVLFFNFQNVVAARTNARQSALDEVQRARLFTESNMSVPASISLTGSEIRFDPSKLMFFGHSQGGLNGPLYLAADDSARGGVLSGSSAVISITLLEKTEPPPSVAGLVASLFLGLRSDEGGEVSEFHPAISLAQMLVDVVDPIHYADRIAVSPRPGFSPKSVYMTEGVNPDGSGDSYAPPHGIEMHALAMGLPLQLPAQRAVAEGRFGGPQPVTVPPEGLAGNLGGGAASGVLAQWPVPEDSDGHFVVFDVPEATAQADMFLKNLADDAAGRVPAP